MNVRSQGLTFVVVSSPKSRENCVIEVRVVSHSKTKVLGNF